MIHPYRTSGGNRDYCGFVGCGNFDLEPCRAFEAGAGFKQSFRYGDLKERHLALFGRRINPKLGDGKYYLSFLGECSDHYSKL